VKKQIVIFFKITIVSHVAFRHVAMWPHGIRARKL
jgi:hypothetical protein